MEPSGNIHFPVVFVGGSWTPTAPRRSAAPPRAPQPAAHVREQSIGEWRAIKSECVSLFDGDRVRGVMRLCLTHGVHVEAMRPLWNAANERVAMGEPIGRELHSEALKVLRA